MIIQSTMRFKTLLFVLSAGISAISAQNISDSLQSLQQIYMTDYTYKLQVISYLNSSISVYLKKHHLDKQQAETLLQQVNREQKRIQPDPIPVGFISEYRVVFRELKGVDPFYFDRTNNTIDQLGYTDTITGIRMWKEVENARDMVMMEMQEVMKRLEFIQRLNSERRLKKRFIRYCKNKPEPLIILIRSFQE